MAGVWKRDGTVAVTNGSKKVTGTGTTFADAKNGVAKGHLFCMTTGTTVDLYEVDYVVSNTELHLVQAFRGTTGTGKAYEIITTFSDSIPEFARKLNASLSYYQSQSDMVQQLFTSDAAEITVTAPDGTTHKLIPWKRVTSEGEGQAARAKVEADRSKTEADRAVTEADRAAGIVAAAALPLPDVWAPLSDSLRLITGYGRDVLVGSDVVARMMNFSRNSAAATVNKTGYLESYLANAPRFTPKGLLGEPSSSNYITTSEGLSQIGTEAGASVVTENGVTLVSYAGIGGLSKDYSAPASSALTLSLYVRIGGDVGSTINVQMRDGPSIGSTASISVSSAGELSVSNTDGILSSWGVEKVSASLVRIFAVIKPSAATLYRLYRGSPVVGETFGSFQLEALPFATSYIKTSGAVTTRVADSAFLPSSGNRFYKPFFSVAFSWSLIGIRTDITDNRLIDFDNDASANRHYVGISQDGKLVAQFGTNRIISSAPVNGGVSVLVVNGSTFSLYHNRVKIGEAMVTGWSGSPNGKINLLCNNTGLFQSAGSMRDLRMWMLALTDAQAKVVK